MGYRSCKGAKLPPWLWVGRTKEVFIVLAYSLRYTRPKNLEISIKNT